MLFKFAGLKFSVCLIFLAGLVVPVCSGASSIVVQSTTSTANSGFYNFLLPKFEEATGITVHVVAVGTGQAIKNASNCDGDVLLVHAKSSEQTFVASGKGVERFDLMYNDFVFVGPASDPAGIAGETSSQSALSRIADSGQPFLSRGDNSGTHKKEKSLWKLTEIDPDEYSGQWYRETGSGMGATLNVAIGMGAYTMADRATWISFQNKSDFKILVEGDTQLFNQYGVIAVNPEACPSVNQHASNMFIEWLLSKKGQSLIADYRLNDQQLFFPNASR
ncbi:MAG: tungstate transport system substrate-binding protein [Gammaproteobacteria bacterium]|jgi:tungstate transport system substrate-binding protein